MESLLDTLSNPYLLVALLALTAVSTFFTWIAIKEKNVANLLIGIGSGIPTFEMTNWKMWAAGGMVCAMGFWLRAKINSPV